MKQLNASHNLIEPAAQILDWNRGCAGCAINQNFHPTPVARPSLPVLVFRGSQLSATYDFSESKNI